MADTGLSETTGSVRIIVPGLDVAFVPDDIPEAMVAVFLLMTSVGTASETLQGHSRRPGWVS